MKSFDEVLDRAGSLNSQFAEPMSAMKQVRSHVAFGKCKAKSSTMLAALICPPMCRTENPS